MSGLASVERQCEHCGSSRTGEVRRRTDEVTYRCLHCGRPCNTSARPGSEQLEPDIPRERSAGSEADPGRSDRRPLAELPALVIASTRADVRGWVVVAHDGRTFGEVVDLLADPAGLFADVLIVRLADGMSNAGRVEALVPLAALEAREDRRQLVPGRGLPPIALRYRSTNALAGYGIAAAALAAALAWVLGAFQ